MHKCKHADLFIHWKPGTNKLNAGHIRSFVRLPNVSSQLYTFSCIQLKNCRLVLCFMFKTIFLFAFCQDNRRIAMLLAPGHNHTAFSFQSPEPSARCTLWETAEKTRRRSFALIVVVKRCGKFIITGKLVLYFKTSGKVKSKWPIGGRLWILLESIWLKIKVIVCINIVAYNI